MIEVNAVDQSYEVMHYLEGQQNSELEAEAAVLDLLVLNFLQLLLLSPPTALYHAKWSVTLGNFH